MNIFYDYEANNATPLAPSRYVLHLEAIPTKPKRDSDVGLEFVTITIKKDGRVKLKPQHLKFQVDGTIIEGNFLLTGMDVSECGVERKMKVKLPEHKIKILRKMGYLI